MKKNIKKTLIASVFILFCVIFPIYGGVIQALEEGGILTTPDEERAGDIFKQLKCLACDGQSIHDSNADFAKSVRAVVRQKIHDGMDDEMVMEFLQENYGDVIFFQPPLNISTFLLWTLPFSMIIMGFSAFVFYLRKQRIA